MDVNVVRSIVTLACLLAFLGIVWWAWGRKRKGDFDEAANLPFADDEMQARTVARETAHERANEDRRDG